LDEKSLPYDLELLKQPPLQARQEAKEKFCGKNECGMLYDKRAN
jgi:hypothetical protein